MRKWLVSESTAYVYGEQMATLVRWATLTLALLLNNLVGGTSDAIITAFNGLVIVVALLNLIPTVALWRGFQPSRWFCRLSIGFDIWLLAVLIFLRGGLSSTVYVLYFPVIFSTAIRFGLWEGLLDALVIAGTYAAVTLFTYPAGPTALEPLAWAQLFIRLLVFVAAAVVSGLLADREKAIRAQRAADERLVAELTTLNEIGQALASTSRQEDLLDLIYRQVGRVMDTSNFSIALYDEAEETIHFPLAIKAGQPQAWRSWRGGSGPAEYVIRTRQPLLIAQDVRERFQELGITFPGEIPCSWLGVPLQVGDRIIGVIAVHSYEPTRGYDEGHQRLLTTIAAQAAVALENARLLQKSEHRARELSTLYEVGQTITSSLDLDTVLDRIMHAAVDLLEVEAGSLVLVEPESQDLVFRIALGAKSEQVQGLRLPAGTGIMGQVVATGQAVIVNDAQSDPHFYPGTDALSGFHTRSILAVPLTSHDQTIGVVEVMNRTDGQPFLPEHRDLLTAFAAQAAIAVENAQIYQRTDEALARRVRELTAIAEVDHRLSATLDFESVNALVIAEAIQATNASAGLVAILDETRTGLLLLAQQGYPEDIRRYQFEPWPVERGITGRVARTGQPVLVPDVHADPDYIAFVPTSQSLLSVPVLREDQQVFGVVTLESDLPANFTSDDLRFVQHLAEHAAIAMQNAQLFADLQRANRELQALNDAKTEFVSIVSHELRAPMTSIKGYVDLILEDEGISEDVREFLLVVEENTDRLAKLVADLLDISRIEAGRISLSCEPVHLLAVVDSVLSTARAGIQEKGLTVTVDLPADLPPVWGDRDRVTQILTNLVSNAVKYTLPGGAVYISARPVGNPVLPGPGGYVQVTVRDTGIGIAPEDQPRLFTKFFRADHPVVRQVAGTGLGLSIVKSLVELHGGRVWVDSQVDQGSAFHFTLPIAADHGTAQRATV